MDRVSLRIEQVPALIAQLEAVVGEAHNADLIVLGQGVSASVSVQRFASRPSNRNVLDAQPIRHGVVG